MKRFLTFFLAAALFLTLPLFPRTDAVQQLPKGYELLADPAFLEAITAQYDAFAAAHYSATAADDTLDLFLEYGFYGKSKYLTLDESSPALSAFLGTAMYRSFFITCMTEAFSTMQLERESQLLVGTRLTWETYSLSYGLQGYAWNETADPSDDVRDAVYVNGHSYTGSTNKCDDAMLLVVGGMEHTIHIRQIRADFDTVTYRLDMRFSDSFSFDSDYSIADKKGFNTTFSKLLNILGPLMGLKPYDWHLDTSMEITLPNLCTHAAESYRWENQNGALVSVSDADFVSNPFTTLHRVGEERTAQYFAMETPVVLSPDQPWSLEFSIDQWYNFSLTSAYLPVSNGTPFIAKNSRRVYLGSSGFDIISQGESKLWHLWYTAYEVPGMYGALPVSKTHVYRLENRIGNDGTASVWLILDGEEVGQFTQHFLRDQTDQTEQVLVADPLWASITTYRLRYLYDVYTLCPEELPIHYLEIREGGLDRISVTHTEGSCLTAATTVRICSRCGATEQIETAPAVGHIEEILPGKAPTCTESGLTEGARCTVCVEITSPQEIIPAAGHDHEAIPGVTPTCETNGLTDGSRCALCGEITQAQESIPATGHCYTDGLCGACGQQDPSLIPGDANGDGISNYQDALLVLRYSIGLETFSPAAFLTCDMDGTCELNYQDALMILRASIGLD